VLRRFGRSTLARVPDDACVHHYVLLDVGGGGRLERLGERVVDRPAPGALDARGALEAWATADLRFDRDRGWSGPAADAGPWPITFAGITLELRPTEAGQVGVFPEHAAMLPWLRARAAPTVLNLFGYTGLTTLALASAGAAVTHVDAARPTVAWARHNAGLGGLGDRPIRWIVDDARSFVAREARRGRHYGGVILDPPSYGHGQGGPAWRLETDLPGLLEACRAILAPTGFVLLTAHTPGFDAERLAALLAKTFALVPRDVERGALRLETRDGRQLDLGAFARSAGAAS
jgi:23S rRNA (cytosine1962-C5)-methyltransferase